MISNSPVYGYSAGGQWSVLSIYGYSVVGDQHSVDQVKVAEYSVATQEWQPVCAFHVALCGLNCTTYWSQKADMGVFWKSNPMVIHFLLQSCGNAFTS